MAFIPRPRRVVTEPEICLRCDVVTSATAADGDPRQPCICERHCGTLHCTGRRPSDEGWDLRDGWGQAPDAD